MARLFSDKWLRTYERELESHADLWSAARWFSGIVEFRCGDECVWLEFREGETTVVTGRNRRADATVRLIGDDDAWHELFSPTVVNGTINRFWRQGRIRLEGNMVYAMQHWLVLFWLTEAGDEVPLNA